MCVCVFEAESWCIRGIVVGYISRKCEHICVCPTCFMAVTVITKKRGRPLVTGLVGVSMISCKGEEQWEVDGGGRTGDNTEKRGEDAK